MKSRSKQQGMTTLGWLIVFGLVGFFALTGVKLAPSYLEYFSVMGVIGGLKDEPGLARKTSIEVRRLIDKRFTVNSVDAISGRDIKIERTGKGLSITAKYEVRTPLFGNVDVITRFYKNVEILAQ